MKIAYFDCFSGISGDMCLGALVDAGVDLSLIKEGLSTLPVDGYELRLEKAQRNGIAASNVFVDLIEGRQPVRRLPEIQKIIVSSALPEKVQAKSMEVFNRLAAAEAAVHGVPVDSVHFHEVGAVDAIVDVAGTVLGISLLQVEKVYSSPLPVGKGFVRCMHGILPSPAPAALDILKGIPIYGTGIEEELVTPTGAALIASLAEAFTDLPSLAIEKIGYGAGKKNMDQPTF